ncbi:hypothetical protein GMMP1_460027 [Candidatus Magnetomoraceae bacterium gMMP-1]
MIVKPKNEAVSFGLRIVENEDELCDEALVIFEKYNQPVVAEQYEDKVVKSHTVSPCFDAENFVISQKRINWLKKRVLIALNEMTCNLMNNLWRT